MKKRLYILLLLFTVIGYVYSSEEDNFIEDDFSIFINTITEEMQRTRQVCISAGANLSFVKTEALDEEFCLIKKLIENHLLMVTFKIEKELIDNNDITERKILSIVNYEANNVLNVIQSNNYWEIDWGYITAGVDIMLRLLHSAQLIHIYEQIMSQ
jgi:hypothetical protein